MIYQFCTLNPKKKKEEEEIQNQEYETIYQKNE